MTLNQFLDKLKPLEWRLDRYGCIVSQNLRNLDGGPCCPLAALLLRGVRYDIPPHAEVAKLGLSDFLARRIMLAADRFGCPATRRRLLKACGLKERT